MLVTKSLENMIDKEEASAFNAFTDGRVHKSNGFDPSDTSEIINVTLTSTVSTEEDIPLKKLDEAETKKVSKNVEILTEERNKDIIKNGDDDNEHLGKKSEDEKLATENSEILIETEKETTPQQNSVEKEETNEKEKTTLKKVVEKTDTHPEEEKNNSENKKGAFSLEPATQSDSENQGTADSDAEDETKKEEKKSEKTVKDNVLPLTMPQSIDY